MQKGIGLCFRTNRRWSYRLHLLPFGLSLKFPIVAAKVLESVHSDEMREIVAEHYSPTDKPPSATLPCMSSRV